MNAVTCPSCSLPVDLSPIAPTLFEAAAREEYQCQACKRWSRREKINFLRLILVLRMPMSLTAAGAILTFRIFSSLARQPERPPFDVWGPLLLGPLAVLLGIAFTARGLRKQLNARKLVPFDRLPLR